MPSPEGRDGARENHVVAHKVLNNNVVISIDEHGRERVLMGRGLGFQLKPDDRLDPAKVEKTFVLDSGAEGDRERQLLTDVPYPVIEAVTGAVDLAERELGHHLGRRLVIPVIDHIQYVLERLDQGVRIPATHMPELRVLHPHEFRAAEHMAAHIATALDRELPPEEAVFLTMHLLNATRDEPNGTAALLFRRVQHVATTVETGLGVTLDVESPDYARFILHVQFLLQRLVSKTMLRSSDTSFFEFAKHSYPRSYAIAEQVKAYVRAATGSDLTDEELLYLIVHVERLASQVGAKAAPDDGGGGIEEVLR
ncbi:beta-glucoside operon transcriptional antiterminator [Microbacterium sp. SORGH_AS428]|uniref:PRD domain-containing protein n=1 Tax=Microbacterium sp. SORGH_AS_0428 TaxID=3041788 RepID=UPI00286666B1|nr:PRD domain-containing protein [Microbacterium sp. SORGH_AS_0428]MDR6199509.1 beta-glucoside operon transcriptional antiterminator [Microbacterium sp. SORGH_AS_0428]